MPTHPLPPAARQGNTQRARPARPARTLHTAAVAGPSLLGLALAAACSDTPAPVQPPAAPAATAAAVGAAATRSLLAKGFVRVQQPTVDGEIAGPAVYNAAGGRLFGARHTRGIYSAVFNTLASVLNGTPHVQVTPVRAYSNAPGADQCGAEVGVMANGADVEVTAVCGRGGRAVDLQWAALVFDHDADAAFATVRPDGSTGNARRLSRVEHPEAGRYRVFFRRDPLFGAGARPVAFVTTGGFSAPCTLLSVGSRHQRADEFGVEVHCQRLDGRRADGAFHVLALAQTPRTGYALVGDGQRVFAEHSSNPGGPIAVHRKGAGSYEVSFHGLDRLWSDNGAALVSTHGVSGESCALDGVGKMTTQGRVRVDVQCRSAAGAPADARFAVLATTRH